MTVKNFQNFLTESKTDDSSLRSWLSKYKLDPKDVTIGDGVIKVQLPDDANQITKEQTKLSKDLKSGKAKHPFMSLWKIMDYYSNDNFIKIVFVHKKAAAQKKLYHITPNKNVDSILKNGLVPSKGDWSIGSNSQTVYEAVFLTTSISKTRAEMGYKTKDTTVLLVDPSGLDLYEDPGFTTSGKPISFVSMKKIPANKIKVK